MTQPLSITKEFSLNIHPLENGQFRLVSINIPAEKWVPSLYLNHRESFFGLNAQIEDNALIASPVELVELFSRKMNPFTLFDGVNEDSNKWLETFKDTAKVWATPDLWNFINVEGNDLKVTAPIDDSGQMLLVNAVKQKLFQAGLSMEDIEPLIPFFQQGGWPIKSQATHPSLLVALRLSEPEAMEDTWLLETVVRGKKAVYTGHQHTERNHYPLVKLFQINGLNLVIL